MRGGIHSPPFHPSVAHPRRTRYTIKLLLRTKASARKLELRLDRRDKLNSRRNSGGGKAFNNGAGGSAWTKRLAVQFEWLAAA